MTLCIWQGGHPRDQTDDPTLTPGPKQEQQHTAPPPRHRGAAAENMLGYLIDAHEKRPGVEHELIREARDRERWLIFFLVCAG